MKIGRWAGLLAAALLLAGCGDFWQAPGGGSSFTLSSNPANITVSAGATGTSTITVTPASSFTGTVTLTCAVTAPTGASSPTTCSLSSSSLTFSSSATAQNSTLTATTSSSTTTGAYQITVTGALGSVSETATVCVEVGTGTCSSTASSSGNFYILNSSVSSSSSIAGYYISSKTLNSISGSSVTVNGIAYAVAMAPNGKFLCVSSSDGVYAYPITSGALGTGVKVTSDPAYAIQIDSTDSWLVEAVPNLSGGEVTLNAVPINSSNGTNTGTTVATASFSITGASLPQGQMVISPDNSYIFVALETGGTIVVPFSSSNPLPSSGGSYIHIPVANTGGSALSVAVDPSSSPRLFYIGEVLAGSGGTTGGLRAFNYSSLAGCSGTSCTLTQATGSPIASGGLAPTFILPVTTPSYVYVANGVGNITGFAVSGSSSSGYTLTTGSTVAAGAQPAGMALDSTGSYVFEVGSSGSPYFDAYTFDASTTGQLDSQITSTSAATSIAIVAGH
ncbi:MAG: hypothetical protein ACLPXT_09080 [Terracidiphilus sp.]